MPNAPSCTSRSATHARCTGRCCIGASTRRECRKRCRRSAHGAPWNSSARSPALRSATFSRNATRSRKCDRHSENRLLGRLFKTISWHALIILVAIFPGKPGLAGCPLETWDFVAKCYSPYAVLMTPNGSTHWASLFLCMLQLLQGKVRDFLNSTVSMQNWWK